MEIHRVLPCLATRGQPILETHTHTHTLFMSRFWMTGQSKQLARSCILGRLLRTMHCVVVLYISCQKLIGQCSKMFQEKLCKCTKSPGMDGMDIGYHFFKLRMLKVRLFRCHQG